MDATRNFNVHKIPCRDKSLTYSDRGCTFAMFGSLGFAETEKNDQLEDFTKEFPAVLCCLLHRHAKMEESGLHMLDNLKTRSKKNSATGETVGIPCYAAHN